MIKKYKDVEITLKSIPFDIELNDGFLKFAEENNIDIEDDEELLKFYLENNFEEYIDLLQDVEVTFEKN